MKLQKPGLPAGLLFRSCLLSGGLSRRMGCDKALLTHPHGVTWLEATLALLLELERPLTLLSGHPTHHTLAQEWLAARASAGRSDPPIAFFLEPSPQEGPLMALGRLMEHHPGERLLLCPVDMPWLDLATLRALLVAAESDSRPDRIHLAHDGARLQPLLALVPAPVDRRRRLALALEAGERGLQRWLAGEAWRAVALPPGPLRNANRPEDLGPSVFPSPAPGP